jgi:hypothetical protein
MEQGFTVHHLLFLFSQGAAIAIPLAPKTMTVAWLWRQAHFAGQFFSDKNILYGHFRDNIPEASPLQNHSASSIPSDLALTRPPAAAAAREPASPVFHRRYREGILLRPLPASRNRIDGKAVSLSRSVAAVSAPIPSVLSMYFPPFAPARRTPFSCEICYGAPPSPPPPPVITEHSCVGDCTS